MELTPESANKYQALVLRAVESLVDENISREFLEEACNYLDVFSFSEVSGERSVAKLCGYPLCSSRLRVKNWPKYRLRGNKVFDTTERRRFCSDTCYEQFEHISKQLPEEPLWFRGLKSDAKPIKLSFLEEKSQFKRSGLPGRELDLVQNDLSEALAQLTLDDDSNNQRSIGEKKNQSSDRTNAAHQASVFSADAVATSFSLIICEESSDESSEDEDDDDYGYVQHFDCETSAVGDWRSPNQSKSRYQRPILIDPLPMKPSKSNTAVDQRSNKKPA